MAHSDREVLAGVRLLVCVARADGRLTDHELAALDGAVQALPSGKGKTSLEELLASDIDFDAELVQLRSPEARKSVYEAALVLANTDGAASVQELAMLERLQPLEGEATLLGQLVGETRDTLLPTRLPTMHDPRQREVEVQEDTLKYAILCAGLGAMPVPGAAIITDLAVVALQVKLVRDIGCYWGHNLDASAARTLLGGMAGSVGLRIAVNNVARLIPGWGSMLGAATSFGTTVAVGRAAHAWFSSGAAMSPDELRRSYEAGVAEGRSAFVQEKVRLDAARERNAAALSALNERLARKEITQEQFLVAVEQLK
jgi:uncharacterized protein (DUF697 family)